jgi:hypothetical protein
MSDKAACGARNGISRATIAAVLFVSAVYLTGCASETQTRTITVPCRATMPARPIMPTESLSPDALLDAFVQAAAAEIERREGYEQELRAAIGACQ